MLRAILIHWGQINNIHAGVCTAFFVVIAGAFIVNVYEERVCGQYKSAPRQHDALMKDCECFNYNHPQTSFAGHAFCSSFLCDIIHGLSPNAIVGGATIICEFHFHSHHHNSHSQGNTTQKKTHRWDVLTASHTKNKHKARELKHRFYFTFRSDIIAYTVQFFV